MQHDEFIGHVQQRAEVGSRGEAERACRATLETLAERLPAGLAEGLAGQLPEEINEHLHRVVEAPDEPDTGERFGRDEFVRRVAERAGGGVDEAQAARWANSVFAVVDQATDGALTEKVTDSLPRDILELVTSRNP